MMKDASAPADLLCAVDFSVWTKRIARLLTLIFIALPAFMALAPWRQHVSGVGRVTAFQPLDRVQSVEAPVSGRVVELFVTEGTPVETGAPLLRLVDIDPEKIGRIEAKIEATEKDLEFTQLNVTTYTNQVAILENARDLTVLTLRAKADAATEKLRAAEQKVTAARAKATFAKEQAERLARLSPRFVEELKRIEAEAKAMEAAADVTAAEAEAQSAKKSAEAAEAELGKEREVANSKVESARASAQSATGKVAEIRAKLADLTGELRAQQTQLVLAPRDGRVFRLAVNTVSSIVKSGQQLLQIVPDTSERAVELMIRGVDVPLIDVGRKVRLQFEGWPAVQVIGWPSVAVGTFGGVVKLVDATDLGNGQFRIVILPDPDDADWPEAKWLRQGVRTKGWVLLDEVRLGYEIWRQLNGFPPSLAMAPTSDPSRPLDGSAGKDGGKSSGDSNDSKEDGGK
jgi:multidrug efflux pump subunit AcrA (membrane-fusion protein)